MYLFNVASPRHVNNVLDDIVYSVPSNFTMSRESVSPRLPEAVDFRFFGRKCKEILDDLVRVDSHRTPAEAANQFNELFHLAEENISLDKGMIESNMWAFAEELIDVAKEIPRDDSRVTRLISTIEELQRFPPKVVRVWGVRSFPLSSS